MEYILIHNNNTAFLSESFFKKQYLFQASFNKDVDSYITDEFIDESLLTDLKEAELVFIKVSLSNNYLEYLGIRLAYHLRLDSRVHNKKFAIVFLGEESINFLCKTYEDYPILLTDGTYKIRDNRKEIESFIEKGIYKSFIKEGSFSNFLDKIWLRPPANFESNHSIANEWGICRLFDAITPNTNKYYQKLSLEVNGLTFKKSLYFKYTEAKIGNRIEFKSKEKQITSGLPLKELKVALIDDENLKGWYSLYQFILDKSNATSFPFLQFSRELSKVSLIERIKEWIFNEAIKINGCNTFILDLRLHEDDFDKTSLEKEELTGVSIYKFIKGLNPGYQIVFVTASNKIWNLNILDEVDGKNYIIKENPDYKFGVNETLQFLHQFNKALDRCKKRIYLIEAYNIKEKNRQKRSKAILTSDIKFLDSALNENGLFDKIYRCLERDIDNQSDLHQALLYCFQFLERYCKLTEVANSDNSNFFHVKRYDSSEIIVLSSERNNWILTKKGKFEFQTNSDDQIISVEKLEAPKTGTSTLNVNAITRYSSVLYFRENCSESEVSKVLELLFIRNNLSAHHTGEVKATYKLKSEDIMFMLRLFDKIKFDNAE